MPIVLPDVFPQFPFRAATQVPLSANFLTAHDILSDIYRHALQILNQEDADPIQLMFHIETLSGDAIPLLAALAQNPQGNEMCDWLSRVAGVLGELSAQLSLFQCNIQNR
jgi:hypothetical protein